MAYEKLRRQFVRVTEPAVTIAPGGRMAMNMRAASIFRDLKVNAFIALWDRQERKLAFQAAAREEYDSYALTTSRSQVAVTARAILQQIEWSATETVVLQATWNAEKKMLEMSVPAEYVNSSNKPANKPGEPAPRNQKRPDTAGRKKGKT